LSSLRYSAANRSPQSEQGISFSNGGGFSAHINVLENFNPDLSIDAFNRIPKGLYQDLRDISNETPPDN